MHIFNFRKIMLLLSALFFFLSSVFFATTAALSSIETVEFENIEATIISSEKVEIEWVTNVPTEGKVIFGTEKDDLKYFIIDSDKNARYHKIELGNLEEDTKYYYRVVIINTYEEVQSFLRMFETGEEEDREGKPPRITDVQVAYISGTTAVVTWETDEDSDSRLEIDNVKTYKYKFSNSKKTTLHRIVIKKLVPNTEYFARVSSTDKNKNSSGYHFLNFKTRVNDNMDKEKFKITNLRPSSPNDSNISTIYTNVSFKTNHWAKGSITLSGKGIRTKKINLDYNADHFASFAGLEPGSDYKIRISMTDVFGKKETEEFIITTKTITDSQRLAMIERAIGLRGSCLTSLMEREGFFAEYFNLPINTPKLLLSEVSSKPISTGWFDIKYLALSQIDENINFGNKFFPLNQGLQEDPNYFSVYWGAFFEIEKTKKYNFKVTSDDDSWIYIDGVLAIDNNGLRTKSKSKSANSELTRGWHRIEVYFVQRQDKGSRFSFSATKGISFHPLPPSCSWLPGFEEFNGISDEDIMVAGIEYTPYTEASALLKTSDSPKIWSILNKQRYNILSPSSFYEYGYKWGDVRTVSWPEIGRYPRASLVRSQDSPAIYYIYERSGNKYYKIKIPSPRVFESYPNNSWGRVVTISDKDINSIPDIPLIKTTSDSGVYRLVNGKKILITNTEFNNKGYTNNEIGVVSQTHLNSYSL